MKKPDKTPPNNRSLPFGPLLNHWRVKDQGNPPIKKVAAFDEPSEEPARATVSRAAVTTEKPARKSWRSLFRQKPAVADDNGEMNNTSD